MKKAKKHLPATAKLHTFKENINISDGIRMKHIVSRSYARRKVRI